MNALMQSSLTDVESKLNTLLKHLTTSPGAAGAPAAAVALLEADDTLSSSIDTLRLHQENYAKILRLRSEAERLEERVKDIVRDLEGFDKEIRTACGDDEEIDSDLDSEDESEAAKSRAAARKEIDYRLLLDFARRISKYNQEAAADVAKGAGLGARQDTRPQIADKDVMMTDTNGEIGTEEGGAEPVSSVTKNATQWLDDSANVTREVNLLPYPPEDRIRMGLMGKIPAEGTDREKEVERLIREAEGLEVTESPAPAAPVQPTEPKPDEVAKTAAPAAPPAPVTARLPAPAPASAPAPAPKPKPKATLDLDLYDPDDDDF
ncbi:uncharacterized protein N7473_001936 [Penicillium subrubescens]|uniref:Mediator of RNA polymerase II transcription subunit 4 n=1 Tax=Penicillium subrubescens TaxID=1316194 RepID=A0A1Q5SQT8_9EURO|nr:uncharacterized protein N7473_001936 [Penicillium subrubescens]KAJ5905020.1 hypothetical protein N7473_001936 [Penicillium subrubescens]OKO90332.1 hypothetical protein PENSUB_13465 [Penicillium subrubescens]